MNGPWGYESIVSKATALKVRAQDLLSLSYECDPFYAGRPSRRRNAEWFAHEFGLWLPGHYGQKPHLRRIHY